MKISQTTVVMFVVVAAIYQVIAGKLPASKQLPFSKRGSENTEENKEPIESLITMLNDRIGDGGELLDSLLDRLLPGGLPPNGVKKPTIPLKKPQATSSVGSGLVGGNGGDLIDSVLNGILHNGGGIENFMSNVRHEHSRETNRTSDPGQRLH